MPFPAHKTKIICTIGPASQSLDTLKAMFAAGMNIARINFSHGDFETHRQLIALIRQAAEETAHSVAIMGDLPGPKMRIGELEKETLYLRANDLFTLTTEEITGTKERVSMSFEALPQVVHGGDRLFINDGVVQLEVIATSATEVTCKVLVGGLLRSRKGLNLPGINLGISAFTEQDRKCLAFAKAQGLDAVSQSFVERAADITSVRQAAKQMDYHPMIVAKIERANALENIDGILEAADGIMIARGDLGVETPIAQIAIVQKKLMFRALYLGKPIITATQMLESMTTNRRPTRAEATDVANAILDGTDGVMLSGESATGKYPVDAVAMLAAIAAATEPHRPRHRLKEFLRNYGREETLSPTNLIALSVQNTIDRITPSAVIVPTRSGYTARNIARFRPNIWISAVSSEPATCQSLLFSYGVAPVYEKDHPENWNAFVHRLLADRGIKASGLALLTEGPSRKNPQANNRMEIIDLDRKI
jgi:pyruvate kinase